MSRKKPRHLKVSQGTYRPDRDNPHAPEFEPLSSIPNPPKYFDDEAVEIWNRVAGELVNVRALTAVDVDQLAHYVTALQIIEQSTQQMRKRGGLIQQPSRGKKSPSPWFQIFSQALTTVNQLSAKFGLSPVDRLKLVVKPIDEENKKEKALMKLVKAL